MSAATCFLALPLDDAALAAQVHAFAVSVAVPPMRAQPQARLHVTLVPPGRLTVGEQRLERVRERCATYGAPLFDLDAFEAWRTVWVLRVRDLWNDMQLIPRLVDQSGVQKPHLTIVKETGGAGLPPGSLYRPIVGSWRPAAVELLESHSYRVLDRFPFRECGA